MKREDTFDRAHAAKDAVTQDAIDVAEMIIYAEAKMGEMILKRPEALRPSRGGSSKPLPNGITWKESHQAQLITNNLDIAEKV